MILQAEKQNLIGIISRSDIINNPKVIKARNEPKQTLKDQIDNLLKTISLQRQQAITKI